MLGFADVVVVVVETIQVQENEVLGCMLIWWWWWWRWRQLGAGQRGAGVCAEVVIEVVVWWWLT